MNKEEPAIVKIGFDYTTIKKNKNIILGKGSVYYYNTLDSYNKGNEDSVADFNFKYNIDEFKIFDVKCNDEDAKSRVENNEDNFIMNIVDNLLPTLDDEKIIKKYDDLHTVVSDIIDGKKQNIEVDLDLYNDNEFITTYKIKLDLAKIGLNQKDDYGFQLAKDLDRIVLKYYYKYEKIPSNKDIEEAMNQKKYFSISLPKEDILTKKIDKFTELIGSWDFRNIDMTEAHLSDIRIKSDNSIYLYSEIYSPELDDYVSCFAGVIKSKTLVKEFESLDLKDEYAVKDFIKELESKINWEKVNNLLNNMETKELKKYNIEQEEEMENEI